MIILPYEPNTLMRRFIAIYGNLQVYAPTRAAAIRALLGHIEVARIMAQDDIDEES